MPPMYNFMCVECEHIDSDIRDYEDRDTSGKCSKCEAESKRTWQGHAVGVARASFPDGSTKRFDGIRRAEELKRASRTARAKGDKETQKRVKKEQQKLRGS